MTIMGDGSGPALICAALTHATRIEGLIFRGDATVTQLQVARGGAVYCSEASPTFVDCRFEYLEAVYGGAVYCTTNSYPLVRGLRLPGQPCPGRGRCSGCGGPVRAFFGWVFGGPQLGRISRGGLQPGEQLNLGLLRCTVAGNTGNRLRFLESFRRVLTSSILVDSWLGDMDGRLKPDCSDLWVGPPDISIDPAFGYYISEDPLFCTTLAGDHHYNLDEASPCTPEASPDCGGMGAMPVGCAMSSVEDPPSDETLPLITRLQETYPNPFNPRATIKFDVSRPGHVTVSVFDLAGRLVKRLVDEPLIAGHHQVVWQGDGGDGRSVAAGVYFVRLKTAQFVDTRRMTLIK